MSRAKAKRPTDHLLSESAESHESRFGVPLDVWSAHQRASEALFRPDRRQVVSWIQHWRQIESIAEQRIQEGLTLHESTRALLFEYRQRTGNALLAKDGYKLFNQIADFLQHGEPNDETGPMAPVICSAFRQLIDEYQAVSNTLRRPITKAATRILASRLMAASFVRNEPPARKARLLEKRAAEIQEKTNWAREFNRLGLRRLLEADSGRPGETAK